MPRVQSRQTTYGWEYKYTCDCGAEVILESDIKMQRLCKCFDCQYHDLGILREILEEDSGQKRKPEETHKGKKRLR